MDFFSQCLQCLQLILHTSKKLSNRRKKRHSLCPLRVEFKGSTKKEYRQFSMKIFLWVKTIQKRNSLGPCIALVRALRFHCRAHRFDPWSSWSGKFYKPHSVAKKIKKKKKLFKLKNSEVSPKTIF